MHAYLLRSKMLQVVSKEKAITKRKFQLSLVYRANLGWQSSPSTPTPTQRQRLKTKKKNLTTGTTAAFTSPPSLDTLYHNC